MTKVEQINTVAEDRESAESEPAQPTSPTAAAIASEHNSDSAGATLAATVELVETVLLFLPPQDILLAQRVDRLWENIIKSSLKLQ